MCFCFKGISNISTCAQEMDTFVVQDRLAIEIQNVTVLLVLVRTTVLQQCLLCVSASKAAEILVHVLKRWILLLYKIG